MRCADGVALRRARAWVRAWVGAGRAAGAGRGVRAGRTRARARRYAWWDKRKRNLHDEKVRKDMIDQLSARKEMMRLIKLRDRKVRKKMGLLRYYCCVSQREEYQKAFPIDDTELKEGPTAAELEAMKKKQREIERRLAELQTKNPETQEWKDYQVRKERTKVLEAKKAGLRPRTGADDRENRATRRRAQKVAEARRIE